MESILQQLIVGIALAGVAAWVTAWLTLRRFRSEKHLERKAEAYTRVLTALHIVKRRLQREEDAAWQPTQHQGNGRALLSAAAVAMRRLDWAVDTSAFYLDSTARETLNEVIANVQVTEGELPVNELTATSNWEEVRRTLLARKLDAIKKALAKLADAAKRELA